MNFTRLLTDLEDMQAERLDDLSDARAEEERASIEFTQACDYFDLGWQKYHEVLAAERRWHEALAAVTKAKEAL